MSAAAPNLESERLRLEPIVAAHASALFDGLQDPELYPYLAADPPKDVAELAERYAFLANRTSPDGSEGWLNWVLFERERDVALGYVQATLRPDASASLGYVLFTRAQRRGFAREAVSRVLRDLLEREIATVYATVDTRNAASIAVLEALGFERFSTERSADILMGERGTDHRYRLVLNDAVAAR